MPVPRRLSSSCGTCVRFEAEADFQPGECPDAEIEQIVREAEDGYSCLYRAHNA